MTTAITRTPVEPGTARWKELVLQGIIKDAQRNWFLGDAALEIAPMGEGTANNGSSHNLAAYADEIGIDPGSLRWYRQVAAAWPLADRSASSHKVHAMFMGHPELIEADGPGVRITVTRASELLGHRGDGRTGPQSSPEDRAKQTLRNLHDPRVLAEVLNDPDMIVLLLAQPAVDDQVNAMLRERLDTITVQRVAAAREEGAQALAEAQAEAAKLRASLAANTDDALKAEIDKAAERIATLGKALDAAQATNVTLEADRSATKAQRDKAREALARARQQLEEERTLQADRSAELARLRQDPTRVARAKAGKQYDWILGQLLRAVKPLADVDNRLDTEPSVLEGEYQEALLRTVDALSMRLTAIRSKLGGEWS